MQNKSNVTISLPVGLRVNCTLYTKIKMSASINNILRRSSEFTLEIEWLYKVEKLRLTSLKMIQCNWQNGNYGTK